MKIPNEFKLFGYKIKVVYNPDLHAVTGDMGFSSDVEDLIILQPPGEDFPATEEQLQETFIHELVHQIFWKIERPDLSEDETMVSLFSKLLYQALTTFK